MYERIPQELRSLRQWHVWYYNAEGVKVPLQVSGEAAKSNDPSTWTTFDNAEAVVRFYQGLALEITEPYTGIDLDNCFQEDGSFRDWALPIIARLDGIAYAEISPSGNGVKFTTRARKPAGSRCLHKFGDGKQQIECYDNARFWTITGNVYNGQDEIGDGQNAVDWICKEYLSGSQKTGKVKHQPAEPRTNWSGLMDRAIAYVESVPGERKGNLRNGAFSLAGHLHSMVDEFGQRLTDDEVHNLLRDWNKKNDPLLRDEELKEAAVNGRKNGTPRADKTPEPIFHEPYDDVDLSKLLASFSVKDVAKAPAVEMPQEYFSGDFPGLIGEVIQHNLKTAHYPLPELALAGALTLMASLTGGKVVDRLRTRTNLYVIGLAPSGSGKDHARKINRQVLLGCGGGEIIGPERIGSHAGIVSALAANWNTLFQIDEIGRLIMTMKDAASSPHLYNISSVLLQVFSSADSVWQADAYGDRSKVKRLYYPHCCIYGTNVPDGFWEALSKENLSDGLIGRFLVFESPEYVDYQEPADIDVSEYTMRRAAAWLELKTHAGNLAGMTNHEAANPKRVDHDEAAYRRLHEHTVAISEQRKKEDKITAAIWSRAAEKTNKLALLFACSRFDGETWPTIQLEDANRAIKLNNYLTRMMLRQAGLHVAENHYERDQLRVLRILQKKPQWTRNEITRATRWLRPRERMEILGTLAETGQLDTEEIETGGRKLTIFRPKE